MIQLISKLLVTLNLFLIIKRLYFEAKSVMKKTQKLETPIKKILSNKNNLADRLFDRPDRRLQSQERRPRIFSNQAQQNRLMPTIARSHQKKSSHTESLPPIQKQNKPQKMKTQANIPQQQLYSHEKVSEIKNKLMGTGKKDTFYKIKNKQNMMKNRMMESRMNRTLTESREVVHLMERMSGKQQEKQRTAERQRLITQSQQILKKVEDHDIEPNKSVVQNMKQVDAFIYLAQQGRVSDYEFYYMVKHQSNDYYNMEIVTYQTVQKRRMQDYFTLSGHGITRYQDARPIEFLNLPEWDSERKQFNEIKQLQFFKKFRKWKSLKKWITILSRRNMKRISDILQEKLFLLNPDYRSMLLSHTQACYQLEQFKFVQIDNEPSDLQRFCEKQKNKRNNLISYLKQCSKQMHHKTKKGLEKIVNELKALIIGDDQFDQGQLQKKDGKIVDQKMKVFADLGFPSNITYGNRSSVRAQFMRFLRLAYLLDFIAIDALGKLFISNIEYFKQFLIQVHHIKQVKAKQLQEDYQDGTLTKTQKNDALQKLSIDEQQQLQLPDGLQFGVTCNKDDGRNIYQQIRVPWKPIFLLNVQLQQQLSIQGSQIQMQNVLVYDIQHNFLNFDLQNFVVVGTAEQFTYDNESQLKRRFVKRMSSKVLKTSPSKGDIIKQIVQFFTDALDSIQVLDKWVKNSEFKIYTEALQQWDQIIGDNWDKSDQKYLNPVGWIRQNNSYRSFKDYVKTSIYTTYQAVQQLVDQHNEIVNWNWRHTSWDYSILKDSALQEQSTVYRTAFKKILEGQQYIMKYMLEKADFFIYSIDMREIRKQFIKAQAHSIKLLCTTYVEIIKERSSVLKQWFNYSISNLGGMIIKIQEFVEQKIHLDKTIANLPLKKTQLQQLKILVKILQQSPYQSLLQKEDKAKVTQISTLSGTLFVSINDAQAQIPKYVQRFKKQIKVFLQKFNKEVQEIKDFSNNELFTKNNKNISQAFQRLSQYQQKMQRLQIYAKKHHQYEQVLEQTETTNFKNFKEVKSDYGTKLKLFKGILDIREYAKQWNDLNFKSVDVKQLTNVCDKYLKDLIMSQRVVPDNMALSVFRKQLFIFRDAIPVISALRCPYLQMEDHQKIRKLLKTDILIHESQDLTLGQFLRMPFQQVQEELIDVSVCATQYYYLKKQLDSFENQWTQVELSLKHFKQASDIIILYQVQQLIMKLDQSLATVGNLLGNRYIAPLRDRADKLHQQIIMSQQIVQKIVECQKKWVYLENIFAANDIKKQLMVQASNFALADKFLKNLMKRAKAKPLITKFIKTTNILPDLVKYLELLQDIEKKLQDYLQVKRRIFPRFYFISNDELVEILANSTNMQIVQKHINKLYEGIGALQMQNMGIVDGMMSQQGEMVSFSANINTSRFAIEIWLSNLQREMLQTMKRMVRDGYKDFINVVQKTRIQWIKQHKSQVVLTDNQVIWCNETQEAIRDQATKRDAVFQWYEMLVKQLQLLTQYIRTNSNPLQHRIAVALITADVHNRDIVLNLVANQTESIHDFNWQQQLKYYLEDAEHCVIKQVNANMDFGYEYLGATSRLVITPLTDKCWITITSAIAHHLGASPAGPAGTGKTESTKDLAKGLGRICIVFNCSDQITAQMMSKLFSGLAQQGAWTCLDEFNRIDIEVLSVIAQQLFSIRVGLKKDKGEIELQGRLLPIRKNFGVFITMNPGYAGRTQLPDNLKSLFRPVSMMIPDYTMIAQIMLFAEGFEHASDLSKKMVQLYKLASQQLSQQKHYDFGLRAVKSLLVMAGELKRNDAKSSQEQVLIKAMKESNVPKFLQNDIYLFEALVSDLFPQVTVEEKVNLLLKSKAIQTILSHKLGAQEQLASKVIQFYQVMNIRFGVMLVGQSGVGKTTCYRILKESMCKIVEADPQNLKYYKVQEKVINPKSVTMGQLYGQIDLLSQEWFDGLLSSVIRQCNNCEDKKHYWITLDGPVDAMWIQNLNTVLDDNMTLCLANSERIKLRKELRMLFEVQNLEAASPATVSRCGMVYLPVNDNYLHYFSNQVDQLKLGSDYAAHIKKVVLVLLEQLTKSKDKWFQPMPTINLQVSQVFIALLRYFLKQNKIGAGYEENIKRLNHICCYAIIWAIGGSLQSEFYNDFQNSFRNALKSLDQNVFFPKTQTIFDFFLSENQLGFVSWETKLAEFEFPRHLEFHDIIVPTIDTLKYSQMMRLMLHESKPILFTGQSGVGKTCLTVPYLFAQKENNIQTIFLNFSAKTKPKQTQLAIQAKLTKKQKTVFGAKINESIVIFIDDINLPELQKQGAQPTIELLRHYLTFQGFFDRQKLFWKQVVDTNLVCCGATPRGGRNKLNLRFTRHFNILCLPQPSQSNLKKIFSSILKGFFNSYNFSQPVKKCADGIVSATLNFYTTIRKQLLPIPVKFHYMFNLRDISRVFQGVLQGSTQTANSSDRIYQLWAHQMSRIFGDRLINEQDVQWFYQNATKISKRFGQGIDIEKIRNNGTGLIFSSMLSRETGQTLYEQIDEIKKVSDFLESKMFEYNIESNGKLQLVFFKEAILHVLKISRILCLPRGNAMLIGVGGSGKQSLSKISSFISNCNIHQLEMGRGYNAESFKGDLQKIGKQTGVQQKKLCFLFVDTQILYQEFLESINNMLNTGQVPNLFSKKQQIDEIINGVRLSALKQKKVDSPQSLWSFFISNIRSNLHIVLCMSPAGDALRVRSRKFPSLINCCTIDWFNSWTQEALFSVAKKFISTMPLSQDDKIAEQKRSNYIQLCKNANLKVCNLCVQYYQNQRRKVEVTPKTFLDQLDLFNTVLNRKNKDMQTNKEILSEGIEKLYSTNDIVAKLKIQMTKLQPQLAQQCIKTEEFLKRLAIDKQQANIVKRDVQAQNQEANAQLKEIKIIKEEAEHQLSKAMPMLLQAEQALKKIDKKDIAQIKGYTSPHPIVQMVMEAVCTLLGEKTDWASMKIVMMEMNFLERLRGYDKNNISDKVLGRLRSYTTKEQFTPSIVGQKNLASKSLCLWCRAIDSYAKVAKQVQPKKKKVAELQRVAEQKDKILFMKKAELNKINEKVDKLQKQCSQTLDYQNKLQSDLNLTKNRLQRAQKLTNLLKEQGLRWNNLLQNYKSLILEIPGEAFLSSVILSYLGPFTGSYRDGVVASIKDEMKQLRILYPSNFSLTNTMFNQITVRDWILQGLPNDSVSVDNAIIAKRGKRYPLMIDPQGQANRWLKVNEQCNNLSVVNFDQTHYLKSLETAVKSGYAVLIEQVEETLEVSIDSLLEKKIQVVQGIKMVVLGSKRISWDDKFYLYMTTRISNPKFLAQVFNKATIINFSITQQGLRDQLLSDVCKLEKPQLQKQRDDIIVQVAANRKFLKQSQDKILRLLAESKGMVLDDVELIETLQSSKVKSKEVEKDLEKNSIFEQEINRARNTFLPVSIRATIVYFVISKLAFIEPMYEFSLNYVKKLYHQGLQKAQSTTITELRIRKLNQSITNLMFTNVSRALFQAHKKLYSFLICTAIKRHSDIITYKQWDLFARGPPLKSKTYKESVANPDPKLFNDHVWYYLSKMAAIPQFSNIQTDIKNNLETFKEYFAKPDIYETAFPGKQSKITKNFGLLLLSKIVKPQNLIFNMSSYVQKQLGKYYDQPIVTSIEQVLSNCEYLTPLLFVLSPGVDPTSNILNYCQSKEIELVTISLGQGQGKKATNMIEKAMNEGNWVLLNNCHLSKSWLPTLQKIIQNLSEETITNKNFRLILSSMPVNYFPCNILQNSNKITLQPPRGIKPNIARSFKQLHEDVLNYCPNRRKDWLKCLYSLTFFHAILQQRRKYGPLGFNVRYDFNDSDLEISIHTLRIFLNDQRQEINWDAVWYMVGQINYGGRVTDDWDRICLISTLKKCLSPQLLSTNDKFYYSDNEDYYCMNCLTLQDFQISIDRFLPNNESPQVFGLHNNANIAFTIQESNRITDCIKAYQPRSSGTSSMQGSTLQTIKHLSTLPQPIARQTIPQHLQGDNKRILPSLSNFLLQEVDKMNTLLSVISDSLSMLQKAIKGIIPMNQQLDQMAYSLGINRIPGIWRKYSYETMKPLASWFIDFKLRVQFLHSWMVKASPTAFWISALFFPQGLLTALLQTHSRKYKIPIDTLSFKFKVTQIERQKLIMPKDGAYVYGLFFDGARWDSGKDTLADQHPGILNEPMPCLLLTPAQNQEINESQYNCPLYKTAKRSGVLSTTGQSTNFIIGIHLNTKTEKSEYWTLKGTALLCQLST